MATEVTLFCVIDGDSSIFSVDISSSKTIDHLKDAIKKKQLEFHDINASKLTLWHVAISSISKKPITLSNLTDEQKAQKNPEKLEDPTSEVSEVFGAVPPKKTIHVIIERPVKSEGNEPIIASLQTTNADLQKEIADLKQRLHTNANLGTMIVTLETTIANLETIIINLHKEMTDLRQQKLHMEADLEMVQKKNAELEQQLQADTYTTLSVVNKRDRNKVICTYSTNIKSATIGSLRESLRDYCLEFEEFEEVQIFVYDEETKTFPLLRDDIQFRSILEKLQQKKWKRLIISLATPAISFSSWDWKKVQDTYKLQSFIDLPKFDLKPKEDLTEAEETILGHIVDDCIRKGRAYAFNAQSNEATRSTIVDAFMVGAVSLYAPDMILSQQQSLKGTRGYGTLDFAVVDCINSGQFLGITEVKKDDHVQGLAQNMVQLDVALHNRKRKRTEEDGDCPRALRAYGIVTNSFQWAFVESTLENGTLKYRRLELTKSLEVIGEMEDVRDRCKLIFGYVLTLFELMKNEMSTRGSFNIESDSPATKKSKFDQSSTATITTPITTTQ